MLDHTKLQLARIYPNGSRVSSTNYNPQVYWNHGCQLVALNYQTASSVPLQLQLGRFERNGRCGYALKPKCLTESHFDFNPSHSALIPNCLAYSLAVEVLSGEFLGPKSCQPIVEIAVYGLAADTKKDFKTRPCRGKGMAPSWASDNKAVFEKIILPQIAMVYISCTDNSGGNSLGWACIPLDTLRQGFRYIRLNNGIHSCARLFCKIDFKFHVLDEHAAFMERLANPMKFSNVLEENAAANASLIEADEEGAANYKLNTGETPLTAATVSGSPVAAATGTPAPSPAAGIVAAIAKVAPVVAKKEEGGEGHMKKDAMEDASARFDKLLAPACSTSHCFFLTTFLKPTACALCKKFLLGLTDQGNECKSCSMAIHVDCQSSLNMENICSDRLKETKAMQHSREKYEKLQKTNFKEYADNKAKLKSEFENTIKNCWKNYMKDKKDKKKNCGWTCR